MISGYRFLHKLGHGGFSTVYLAEQEIFERQVAVKVMHSDLRDPDARRRFVRECRATGRLTGNRHIITVFDAGTTDDHRPYLAMEYLPAGTLRDRLTEIGPLPVHEVVTLAVPVAQALDAAHQHGILHRDLKPANILLRGPDEPVLSDFGIASVAEGREAVTVSAAFTAGFAAPEVILGEQPEKTSDVFGLGATLFALLTQSTPFPGRTPTEIYHRVVSGEMQTFGRPDVPPALEDLLRGMLAPAREHRPPLGEVTAGLVAVLAALDTEPGAPARRRPPPAGDDASTAVGPGPAHQVRTGPPYGGGGPGAGVGGPTPSPATRPGGSGRRRVAAAAAGTAVLLSVLAAAAFLLVPRSGDDDDRLEAGPTTGPGSTSPLPPGTTPPAVPGTTPPATTGSPTPPASATGNVPGEGCTTLPTPLHDHLDRKFDSQFMCATGVGSAVYANVAADDPTALDDSGYMDQSSSVWVICQLQGRANPDLGGHRNTWWLYTQGDTSRPNNHGYLRGWGYLPATAIASGRDGQPVAGVPRCPAVL